MKVQETKKTLQSRGYFEVVFEPSLYQEDLLCQGIAECGKKIKELMTSSQVRLRGWYYPHIPTTNTDSQEIPYAIDDAVESWTDSGIHKEMWRMYHSGQFIHRFSVIEDWLKEDTWFKREDIEPMKKLDSIGVIYRFTEVLEFIKRLFASGLIKTNGGSITITLYNTKDREVDILFDRMRAGLFGEYITRLETIKLKRNFSEEEITTDAGEIAISLCSELFSKFNWDNQPTEVFTKDQAKFLNRQI